MSDVEAEFDKIDKLLGLTPFFRCPNCGQRDEDGTGSPTFFLVQIPTDFMVDVDDTRKEIIIDLSSLDAGPLQADMKLLCNSCQHEFEFPIGWTYRYK